MIADQKLSPTRRLAIGAVTAAMAAAGFISGRILLRPNESVLQPVQFNHQIHGEAGLECSDCHEYYAAGAHSGLPTLAMCLGCHEEPITDSAEEQTLLAVAAENPQEPFRKLFRMPDHVYYSHRQHVTIAGLECEICHGAVAETSSPPPTPLVRITMDTCVDCHVESNVSNDCTHCHR